MYTTFSFFIFIQDCLTALNISEGKTEKRKLTLGKSGYERVSELLRDHGGKDPTHQLVSILY